jgi:hypothetical protein
MASSRTTVVGSLCAGSLQGGRTALSSGDQPVTGLQDRPSREADDSRGTCPTTHVRLFLTAKVNSHRYTFDPVDRVEAVDRTSWR